MANDDEVSGARGLRAERDDAIAARDEHGKAIGLAIQALHDAGIVTFGSIAEGIAQLSAYRAKCEETERALARVCDSVLARVESRYLSVQLSGEWEQRLLTTHGLWRDPAPTGQADGGEGGR